MKFSTHKFDSPPSIPFGSADRTLVFVYFSPCVVLLFLTWRFFSSALRSFPGPWYSKWTNLVLKYHVLMGRRAFYIHDLHRRYGSVVRTALNELDVSDLESFREIHKITGGFLKSPWYQKMRETPVPDTFTFIDPKAHAARRRLLARPFSNSSLRAAWEEFVKDRAYLAVAKIKREAEQGEANVLKWWTLMAYDIITKITFGENPQMLESGRKSSDVNDLESIIVLSNIRVEMKQIFNLIASIPIGPLRHLRETKARFDKQGWKAVENAKKNNLGRANVFTDIISHSKNSDSGLRDVDAATEAQNLIVGGSDTTAATLTYLIWVVLKTPELHSVLKKECAGLPPNFSDVDLEKQGTLNAVINETLRLYGAAPGSLPRIVPPGGATMAGRYVREGVTVCTQAYTIHRDPEIFDRPEMFDHTRWLQGKQSEIQTTAFHPFGAGSRTCLGMHLARMEMRYATAFFFRECAEARLADSTTPESMAMKNYFLIFPASRRCGVTMDGLDG